MKNIISAYREQEILSADPMELVCMLYQAAIAEVREARRFLKAGDILARSGAISKACDIISELISSLKTEVAGELSTRLHSLYGYLLNRLLEANMQKADAPLAEVLDLLTTLGEGWQGAVDAKRPRPPMPNMAHLMADSNAEHAAQSWSF